MAVGTNRWKLGLFVLTGIALAVVAVVVFGARSFNQKTVTFFAFFDESVQGLDPGSPVKFRGVTIGRVAAIDVAPDHRHVQVELDLSSEKLEHLDLRVLRRPDPKELSSGNLRVQLAQTGITGVKFVLLDFFDQHAERPAALPFRAPPNTLPAMPSMFKSLEDSVTRATDRVPEIADALLGTVTRLNAVLDSVGRENLPGRTTTLLNSADSAMVELKHELESVHAAELSAHVDRDLAAIEQTLKGIDRLVARLDSDKGLVGSAERAANSLDNLARGAQSVGPEMELTLREVRATARSIRRFTDDLERDPDMLLKGRASAAP